MAYKNKINNDLFSFISEELKLANISIKDLNTKTKYKDLRYSFVHRAYLRYLETQPKNKKGKRLGKEEVAKYIRKETGIKFSNEIGRSSYNKIKNIKTEVGYGARISKHKLADINKVPLIEYPIKELWGYGYTIYRYKKNDKRKSRELPKSAERVSNGKYNSVSDYIFWSEVQLTGNDADLVMYYAIGNHMQDLGRLYEQIEGSDYQDILKDKSHKIIGFKFNRLFRT